MCLVEHKKKRIRKSTTKGGKSIEVTRVEAAPFDEVAQGVVSHLTKN